MEELHIEPLQKITIGFIMSNNEPKLVVYFEHENSAVSGLFFADSLEDAGKVTSAAITTMNEIPYDKKWIHNENNQRLEILKWFSDETPREDQF